MLGVIKLASIGAVLSYGALAAYEQPSSKLRAAVEAHQSASIAARPVRAAPKTAASSEASCKTVRRKLWIEGEGWVVKAVARC